MSIPGIPMTNVLNKSLTVIGAALYNPITYPHWKCREVTEEIRNRKPFKINSVECLREKSSMQVKTVMVC